MNRNTPRFRSAQRSLSFATALAVTGSAILLGPTAAFAETEAPSTYELVQAATPDTVAMATQTSAEPDGTWAIQDSAGDSSVLVPNDASDGISFDANGLEIGITLPFSGDASAAEEVAPGIVSFDNNNGSTSVPVAMENNALQINTIIDGPESPTRYDYSFDLPSGVAFVASADGSYVAMSDAGEFVFAVGAPWAKDANGNDVPTRYELNGNTLTQVVDHNIPGVAYPVVADPTSWTEWWGVAVKLTRAETINVKNNFSPAYFSSIACSYTGGFAPVCAAGVALRLYTWEKPIKDAAGKAGRCAQLNLPWGSGPVLWNVTNVAC